MDHLRNLVDLFLHLDKYLVDVVRDYGTATYAILFAIVFCETGLVVTPFLPGDSLLFAAGALAANGTLELVPALGLMFVAAVLGDAVNYSIGKRLGPKVLSGKSRFLRKDYLDRTHAFYERYGGKTIIIARFVPIVRTFAPFLAGVGSMSYARFAAYNVIGAALWVASCGLAGFWFGGWDIVRNNFSLVVLAIIAISVLPAVVEIVRERRRIARLAPVGVAPMGAVPTDIATADVAPAEVAPRP